LKGKTMRQDKGLHHLSSGLLITMLLSTFVAVPGVTASAPEHAHGLPAGAGVLEANGPTAIQQTKLVAPAGQGEDAFGIAVALSGDTAVVGATGESHTGLAAAGAAYVYKRTNGVWNWQASLVAADAEPSDHFGAAVAISGDTALVGAPDEDHAGSNEAGAVYVFTRSAGVWSQQAKLVASNTQALGYFGISVSISGDTAVVGTAESHAGLSGAGAVYIFTRSGGTWSQQARLVAPAAQALDYFGREVAIVSTGTLVAITAPGTLNNTGAAYIFTLTSGAWSQQARLVAAGGGVGDLFGSDVALSSNTLVVGAHNADAGSVQDAGAAYVFTRSGSAWSQQAKLVATDAQWFDSFGIAVGLNGDVAVVGANYEDPGGFYQGGSVYVFRRNNGVWSQQAKLVAADVQVYNYFGQSLSFSGQSILVGAFGNGPPMGPVNVGAAYVFTPGP
jgi:hypothetical protein